MKQEVNLNIYEISSCLKIAHLVLTLNLLTTTIVAPPSNASKWQMGFNSVFKGLIETDQSVKGELRKIASYTGRQTHQ